MVSGLVTSPHDHQVRSPCSSRRSRSLGSRGPRISSGEAIRIAMWSKLELFGSRPLRKSIMVTVLLTLLGGSQRHLEPQRLKFLDQDVEGSGMPGSGRFWPFTIASYTLLRAVDVVRLDRQHLLEKMRRAVRFQRPTLPFHRTAGHRTAPYRRAAVASPASTARSTGRGSCRRPSATA